MTTWPFSWFTPLLLRIYR